MNCGLLGRKLGHSYSPAIHAQLGDYEYHLYEKEPEELEAFLLCGDWDGINVTIPYKTAVLPYLDIMTPIATQLGAVNTIIRRNGKLIGTNTDHFGFTALLQQSGLSPTGKKCLVLGSGGASKVVEAVLRQHGAEVIVISRQGEHNYTNLHLHQDAAIIINATPVGMYPNNGNAPVDLGLFPHLEGVLDLVYNPARTKLLIDAAQRNLVAVNGLSMLVAQAKEAAEWFTETAISNDKIGQIQSTMESQMENIVLIGMPGCGKSTIGALLAQKTGRTFVDTDAEIEKLAQKTIPQIFAEDGEAVFRDLESSVLEQLGKRSGLVIATGGGCVTRAQNYPLLHQNATIYWLQRDLPLLPTEGRPLSVDVEELYRVRQPMYHQFADRTADNNGTIEATLCQIIDP